MVFPELLCTDFLRLGGIVDAMLLDGNSGVTCEGSSVYL
jgi:hypothetical protein